MRYVIDFYTGRADGPAGNLSFFLDVRPALDSWDAVRLRAERFWGRWVGGLFAAAPEDAAGRARERS